VSDFPRVHRPCDECPWRRDAPAGRFAACRYDALRETAGAPGREAGLQAPIFACHKTADGQDRACASWLAVVGVDHLGVRLAVATGLLSPDALLPKVGWPDLYGSYEELARANGAHVGGDGGTPNA
jgi:hypothetical protein